MGQCHLVELQLEGFEDWPAALTYPCPLCPGDVVVQTTDGVDNIVLSDEQDDGKMENPVNAAVNDDEQEIAMSNSS